MPRGGRHGTLPEGRRGTEDQHGTPPGNRPGMPRLLVEPTAGGGAPMAARVEQLEAYFAALDGHPKLGVRLDTVYPARDGRPIVLVADGKPVQQLFA